jgi:formate/nitrite transporter FocA (FNT family)
MTARPGKFGIRYATALVVGNIIGGVLVVAAGGPLYLLARRLARRSTARAVALGTS